MEQPKRIAIGLLVQDGEYILQLRESDPMIGAAGKIGCFGGGIKDGETPQQAVARELGEETTLESRAEDWLPMGRPFNIMSDRQGKPVEIEAHVFRYTLLPGMLLGITEGQAVRTNKVKALRQISKMTPATRVVFLELL
jgi:8-oxo-dGTP pyrophosphatase MutT (NUDIX family)